VPATVEVANRARSTARFKKVPVGAAPPGATLAGATFSVMGVDGAVAAECTTGEPGTCSLPDAALVSGELYCWAEVAAPFGWAVAEPGCFTAGMAGAVVEIAVDEQSRYADLTARKTDAVTGTALADAVYDLFRVDTSQLHREPPSDPPSVLPGTSWVGRATSNGDGELRWPLVDPDARYCIVEHTPPPGYQRSAAPMCADHAHTPERPVHLDVVDHPVPPPTTAAPTTTQPEPTTTVPPATAPPTTAPPSTSSATTTAVPPTTLPTTTTTFPPPATRWEPRPLLPVTGGHSDAVGRTGVALIGLGAVLHLLSRRAIP
jgi:uncharacterized surface anchored protein